MPGDRYVVVAARDRRGTVDLEDGVDFLAWVADRATAESSRAIIDTGPKYPGRGWRTLSLTGRLVEERSCRGVVVDAVFMEQHQVAVL
jgi:hypothetical protein